MTIRSNKIFTAVVAMLAILGSVSCSKWTEPESMPLHSPSLEEMYPEEYADYIASIRAYRQTDHQMVWGWFDNSASSATGQSVRLTAIPDSLDAVVLMYPELLDSWEVEEMHAIQQERAVKVMYTIRYSDIVAEYEASLPQEDDTTDDSEAEVTETMDETDASPAEDGFIAVMDAYLDRALPLCEKYAFDGITVWYDPVDYTHIEESASRIEAARHTAFLTKLNEWIAANPEKMFVMESSRMQYIMDSSILEASDYIVVHTELETNIIGVSMAVNNLLVENIPTDRFIVLSHMTSSSDPRLGYITDTDGNSVNATWEIAWWVREPAEGMTKAGLGIYAINSDYWYNIKNIISHPCGACDGFLPAEGMDIREQTVYFRRQGDQDHHQYQSECGGPGYRGIRA